MANLTVSRLPRATGIAQVDDSAFVDEGSTGMTVRLTSSLDSFGDQGLIVEGPPIGGSGPTIAIGLTTGAGAGGFEAQTFVAPGDISFSFITLAHGGTVEAPTYLLDTTIVGNYATFAYASGTAGDVTYKTVAEINVSAAGDHSSGNAAVIYAIKTWNNAQDYSTRFEIDDDGYVILNGPTTRLRLTAATDVIGDPGLSVSGPGGAALTVGPSTGEGNGLFAALGYGANEPVFNAIRYGGTVEVPTAVGTDVSMLNINGYAYNGTDIVPAVQLLFVTAEVQSVGHAAGRVQLATVDVTSQTLKTRLAIDEDGHVHVLNGFLVTDDVQLVSALPSASSVPLGTRTMVSDASTPVFAAIVAGGGGIACPVYSDHVNWRCG